MNAPLRSISVETLTAPEIVYKLARNHFLIPTFQRDFVWKPPDVLALWDSMYRSFPIGSILCWLTDEQLDTHRRIGGFALEPDPTSLPQQMEYRYILDGQQRLTSLFIAYKGGRGLVDDESFDFSLYIDPTASDDPGADKQNSIFLFANDLNRRKDELRRKHLAPELIIKLGDEAALDRDRLASYSALNGYSPLVAERLTRLYRMLHQYRIPFTYTQGVGLSDVCDIYERINQRGRKLSTADIVVARTFRGGATSFNLRGMFDDIRAGLSMRANQWQKIDHLALLQMIGICLRAEQNRQTHTGRNPYGIDKAALLNLTPAAIQPHWDAIRRAIRGTIEFLATQGVYSRSLLPAAYLALPLCAYLYLAPEPNVSLMKQWFWRSAFDYQSIDSESDVYAAIANIFAMPDAASAPTLKPLTLNIRSLVRHYPHDSSFRLATLAFLSSLGPRDLADGHVVTESPAYTDAGSDATIHHIYPRSFLTKARATSKTLHRDSLMNLSFMSQQTNQDIGDSSPVDYFARYRDNPAFDDILASQLIPSEFALRTSFDRTDYRAFLFARATLFAQRFVAELPDVPIKIADK